MSEFVEEFWPVFHAFPLKKNWHIDVICRHLEAVTRGEIHHLLINVPPGMMKSLIVSVFWPAWVWLSVPSYQWLAVSGSNDVALRDATRMRALVQDSRYLDTKALLGFENWSIDKSQKSKSYFSNTAMGHRISKSTGSQSITGLRGDAILVDDPQDASESNAELIAEGNDWFDRVLSTRTNDPEGSPMVVIMQRLDENDLCGHLHKRGGFVELVLPAEIVAGATLCKTPLWSDTRKVGELLFPTFLTQRALTEKLEQLGSRAYTAQYLQTPVPIGGEIFRYDWFKWWRDAPTNFDIEAWSWDMTLKKSKDADYVVGQLWGMKGREKYLLRQVRGRMSSPEVKKAVLRAHQENPTPYVLIENTANGPAVIEAMSRDTDATVIPIDPQGNSKEGRAQVAAIECENGNVFLPDPLMPEHRWVNSELTPELCSFPAARHDDQVDAFSQFLVWVTQNFSQFWAATPRKKR